MPNKLIAMKNGSPLLIGVNSTKTFIASEPSAFSRYTKEYIALQDMEIAVVGAGSGNISLDLSRIEQSTVEDILLTPGLPFYILLFLILFYLNFPSLLFFISYFNNRPVFPLDDQRNHGTTNRHCKRPELWRKNCK
jgi:hypothetical protein